MTSDMPNKVPDPSVQTPVEEKTASEIRQGDTGVGGRYVLIASLIITVLAIVIGFAVMAG